MKVWAAVMALCVCRALESSIQDAFPATAQPLALRPRDTCVLEYGDWAFELEVELARDPPHYDAGDESIDIRQVSFIRTF